MMVEDGSFSVDTVPEVASYVRTIDTEINDSCMIFDTRRTFSLYVCGRVIPLAVVDKSKSQGVTIQSSKNGNLSDSVSLVL